MKGNRKYIIILTLCFAGLISIQLLTPKPVNWHSSYVKKDNIPYGTAALYNALPDIFTGQKIRDASMPLYNSVTEGEYKNANYIIINSQFDADTLDIRRLLNFVKEGNTAFIAAHYFSEDFADSLHIETSVFFDRSSFTENDTAALNHILNAGSSGINFTNPALKADSNYVYSKCFDNAYFTSIDTLHSKILGVNAQNGINFISMKMGKGSLYLSTVPEAFCNYHFANERNNEYALKALSYLPNADVIWDEHYKDGKISNDSIFRVIFDHPALSTAYYLLLFSLLIFMIIGIKRRQRIIPVIQPLQNTTLEFVDTIGALYFQTGNHKNIADKKILYFLEYIRSAFQVRTTAYDDPFIDRITELSGIPGKKVQELFLYFSAIGMKKSITQQELLKLNRMIEEFHQLNKR